jgi:hypothetical protein
MTEIQEPDFARSTIELLLQQNEVADALALISSWLAKHPLDREASLYSLLAAVHLHGPEVYEQEIDDLRRLSNLDEKEKQLVRRIFILGFHAAEQAQQEDKIRAYQRLLRRLLLGQPLDQPIPVAETRRSDIPEMQLALDASSPPAALTLSAEAKKPLPAPRKKTPSKYTGRRFAFGIGAVALLVLQIAYFRSGNHLVISPQASRTKTTVPRVQIARRPSVDAPVVKLQPATLDEPTKESSSQPQLGGRTADPDVPTSSGKFPPPASKRPTKRRKSDIDVAVIRPPRKTPPNNSAAKSKLVHSDSQGDDSTDSTAKSEVPNETSMSYVILRRIALREEPRFAGATVQEVDAGTQIYVLAVHGDWLKVKTRESGIVGYIRREHVIRSDLAR